MIKSHLRSLFVVFWEAITPQELVSQRSLQLRCGGGSVSNKNRNEETSYEVFLAAQEKVIVVRQKDKNSVKTQR